MRREDIYAGKEVYILSSRTNMDIDILKGTITEGWDMYKEHIGVELYPNVVKYCYLRTTALYETWEEANRGRLIMLIEKLDTELKALNKYLAEKAPTIEKE